MWWMRIQNSLAQADLLTLNSASRENTVYLLEHAFLPAKCSSWGKCYKSRRRSFQWPTHSCLQTQEYPWWGKIMWLLQAGGSWHTLRCVRHLQAQLVIAWFRNDCWEKTLLSLHFNCLWTVKPVSKWSIPHVKEGTLSFNTIHAATERSISPFAIHAQESTPEVFTQRIKKAETFKSKVGLFPAVQSSLDLSTFIWVAVTCSFAFLEPTEMGTSSLWKVPHG